VKYQLQNTAKYVGYIGQFKRVRNGRMWANFLRKAYTKEHQGYVYSEPIIKDFSSFLFDDVVQVLAPPETYLRDGLFKFDIHAKVLKNMD